MFLDLVFLLFLASKGPLTMLRNVIIGYYGWGLMITPEIYNHKISENWFNDNILYVSKNLI